MAAIEVHYNIQQMHFELLTYACHRGTGANIGNTGQRFITQSGDFYRIHPFYRGHLTAQRDVRRRETYCAT
ncbi:hypothetical protein D3C85_1680350 [compost metagenome]